MTQVVGLVVADDGILKNATDEGLVDVVFLFDAGGLQMGIEDAQGVVTDE